jgi:hypothetical protein
MVGLIPLFAVETLDPESAREGSRFHPPHGMVSYLQARSCRLVSRWLVPGKGKRTLLSLLRGHRMKALLRRMLDPNEFLSDYGVRSVSRYHLSIHTSFWAHGHALSVDYEPAESRSRLFGGNSNWRGPIWFPMNFLIIESLQKFHYYYGDDFKIECPTGSGTFMYHRPGRRRTHQAPGAGSSSKTVMGAPGKCALPVFPEGRKLS